MRPTTACGCSIIWVSDEEDPMPNKHLEHPEDSILSGRRNALRAVRELIKTKTLSVKWDGAPAIVFGMTNGSFFVGTKSVFNKRRPKINRCPADIDKNHKGAVADILRLCYRHLPRVNGIYQADWIGVGGGQIYQPNTIEYRFSEPVYSKIIVAPHTQYTELSPDAEAKMGVKLASSDECYMVDTNNAEVIPPLNFSELFRVLPSVILSKVPNKSRVKIAKHINSFVRHGHVPHPEEIYDQLDAKYKGEVNVHTFKAWHLISQLKHRLLDAIVVNDGVDCYINGKSSQHEGYVIVSDNPYKIVDRLTFSKANFNLDKNWTYEKV
tara:strand:+ start:237 stop:1208 length:972 start_codon:yes stop_codon:yes gene_type:complete